MNLLGNIEPSFSESSLQIIQDSALMPDNVTFPTTLMPVYAFDEDNDEYLPTNRKALIDVVKKETLYIGSNYNPVSNRDIMLEINNLRDQNWYLDEVRCYGRRYFDFRLQHVTDEMTINNMSAKKCMRIVNSYDGSASFSVQASVKILICGNGATLGKTIGLNIKHIGNNQLYIVDKIRMFEEKMRKAWDKATNKAWFNYDEAETMKRFRDLTSFLPEQKSTQPHLLARELNKEFETEYHNYHNSEFALFMAATTLATHGYNRGIAATYQRQLDTKIPQVFGLN